jgi:hypothetical protein
MCRHLANHRLLLIHTTRNLSHFCTSYIKDLVLCPLQTAATGVVLAHA